MKPIRRQRIASFLQGELSQIIQLELADPRIGIVSITRVKPTEDLKEAVVYITALGSPAEQRKTLRGLHAARGHMQRLLSGRHQWRQTPILRFRLDEEIRRQAEIEDLIRRARADESTAETGPASDS